MGEPGVGKSTLVIKVLESLGLERPGLPLKSGLILYHDFPEVRLAVIGDYSRRSKYPGTDRMSMEAPPQFPPFLRAAEAGWAGYSVLFEGDRLCSRSVLDEIRSIFPLDLIFVTCNSKELTLRRNRRLDMHSRKFRLGRRTKVGSLSKLCRYYIENSTEKDLSRSALWIADKIRIGA